MGRAERAHHGAIDVGTALRAFAHAPVVATVGALLLVFVLDSAATGQQRRGRPTIENVQLGAPVSALPEEEFVDPACGTNGGPPGLRLDGFEQFARCRAEASGLHEVWFRYDDEL
jgi:hypothetical protein